MKRLIPLVLLLAISCGSLACASLTPDATMKGWIGKAAQEAILQWGPPARTITDGADGQVMEWRYWVPPAFVPYLGNIGSYWQTRCFYVHADGTIYAYRWQGL